MKYFHSIQYEIYAFNPVGNSFNPGDWGERSSNFSKNMADENHDINIIEDELPDCLDTVLDNTEPVLRNDSNNETLEYLAEVIDQCIHLIRAISDQGNFELLASVFTDVLSLVNHQNATRLHYKNQFNPLPAGAFL